MTSTRRSIGAVVAMLAAVGLARAFEQCCGPVYNHAPRNISWRIVTSPPDFPNFPISVYHGLATTASQKWNDELSSRGQNVSVGAGPNDLRIIFSTSHFDGQAHYSPDANAIILPMEYHTDDTNKYSGEFIMAIMLHEFGHPLGWGQAPCLGTSVMSDTNWNSFRTEFTDCDRTTFTSAWRTDEPSGPDPDDVDGDGAVRNEDCDDDDPNVQWGQECCAHDEYWDEMSASCIIFTPILVPLGQESQLTTAAGGVRFDVTGDGTKEQISWTPPGTTTAWLVLDRNANGQVDNGTELFGSMTPQIQSENRNGFEALRLLDVPSLGGNGDGWLDSSDRTFDLLRLWTDVNHDGLSQPAELKSLVASGVTRLSLSYQTSMRRDRADNLWRYRAKIEGIRTPWMWDVILQIQHQ